MRNEKLELDLVGFRSRLTINYGEFIMEKLIVGR